MNEQAQQSEIMTTKEVAKYLRLCNLSISKLAKDGKLPAFRVGRAWRYRRADIEAFASAGGAA